MYGTFDRHLIAKERKYETSFFRRLEWLFDFTIAARVGNAARQACPGCKLKSNGNRITPPRKGTRNLSRRKIRRRRNALKCLLTKDRISLKSHTCKSARQIDKTRINISGSIETRFLRRQLKIIIIVPREGVNRILNKSSIKYRRQRKRERERERSLQSRQGISTGSTKYNRVASSQRTNELKRTQWPGTVMTRLPRCFLCAAPQTRQVRESDGSMKAIPANAAHRVSLIVNRLGRANASRTRLRASLYTRRARARARPHYRDCNGRKR